MNSATIIDGKQVSEQIREQLRTQIESLSQRGITPGLAVVLVGDDPASQVYVRNKARSCEQLGMYSEVHRMPAATHEHELLELIDKLNHKETIHGILVQLPLPKHISEKSIIEAIAVEKDVDGFHPENVGRLVVGEECYLPCTPAGVIELLKHANVPIAGKHAVVVGRSNIVGKPVSFLLLQEHATVTICHSRTLNLTDVIRKADIVIAAVGRAQMITSKHVKPGAVVIDVGINRLADGRLVGDVDFDDVKKVASFITPVPGGVGPMTITMLLKNTVQAAQKALM
jgi:methylenetetrahydrofolate dehydrogenase (NADP+)/methenyltetrahydrofolate cyclohydrolase